MPYLAAHRTLGLAGRRGVGDVVSDSVAAAQAIASVEANEARAALMKKVAIGAVLIGAFAWTQRRASGKR